MKRSDGVEREEPVLMDSSGMAALLKRKHGLGIAYETLHNYAVQGRVPSFEAGTGTRRYPRFDVDDVDEIHEIIHLLGGSSGTKRPTQQRFQGLDEAIAELYKRDRSSADKIGGLSAGIDRLASRMDYIQRELNKLLNTS